MADKWYLYSLTPVNVTEVPLYHSGSAPIKIAWS